MFLDEVKIQVRGGNGGPGCRSMRREKYVPRGGPDGGNGGHGGDVVLVANERVNTLSEFRRRRHVHAPDGGNGLGKNKYGRGGEDVVVEVPLGTVVKTEDGEALADLVLPGERFVAARGGRGGRGNAALATPQNPVPEYAEKGEPGEERWLLLELKLLADVGLVGFPNVGKSTLISRLSAARPKIADYPFTTIHPQLGVVSLDRGSSFVLADIPGLIEGAHEGKGLGTRFLRHVERCRLIVHLVDCSGFEGRDPAVDYRTIRAELKAYSKELASKPEIIAATKMDVSGAPERARQLARKLRKKVLAISSVTGEGLPELVNTIASRLAELPHEVHRERIVHRFAVEPDYRIERDGDTFVVRGKRVERVVAMTDLENDEAVEVLARKLQRMGLEEDLDRAGAQEGDVVRIGSYEFTYQPGL